MNVFCCSLGWDDSRLWESLLGYLKNNLVLNNYWQLGSTADCRYNEDAIFYATQSYCYSGAAAPYIEKLLENLPTFIDMSSRVASIGKVRNQYRSWIYHEYVNHFSILCDFFCTILKTHNIDLVIFSTPPYLGVDYILYIVAQALGVKTLIFRQSLFPNRFFYMEKIEDYGIFHDIPDDESAPSFEILKSFKHDWFYMMRKKKSFRSSFSLFINKTKIKIKNLMQITNKFRLSAISNALNSIEMFVREKEYKKNYYLYAQSSIDLKESYVYFPLHLQPEQTTSTFGNGYCDQIKAIEKLSLKLPSHWKIYVKENPKQGFFMRDSLFFKRLKGLNQVILVSKNFSTSVLTEHAKFIATISGTNGWESICGGKPVLIFGHAWYGKLPGAFHYSEDFSIDDLLSYQIDYNELQEKFNALLKKSRAGVLSIEYKRLVPDYSDSSNLENVRMSLLDIFSRLTLSK